jgi:sulfoxide reductase heme-binding subunit YedZ
MASVLRWLGKPAVFLASLVPAGLLVFDAVFGRLEAEPIKEITHRTGWWGLAFLLITLAVTPLRRFTGWNWVIKYRRMLGLFAFFYVTLHFLTYLVLDQFFAFHYIVEDVAKRPYITIGFTSFLLLIPLAITSTNGMIRRLGKRWQGLHRLAYVAATGGVLHFLWLVKIDVREPTIFVVILVGLLAARLGRRRSGRARRPLPAAVPAGASREPVQTAS